MKSFVSRVSGIVSARTMLAVSAVVPSSKLILLPLLIKSLLEIKICALGNLQKQTL